MADNTKTWHENNAWPSQLQDKLLKHLTQICIIMRDDGGCFRFRRPTAKTIFCKQRWTVCTVSKIPKTNSRYFAKIQKICQISIFFTYTLYHIMSDCFILMGCLWFSWIVSFLTELDLQAKGLPRDSRSGKGIPLRHEGNRSICCLNQSVQCIPLWFIDLLWLIK